MQNKKSLLQRLLVIYITFFIVLVASIAHGILPNFSRGAAEGAELGNDIAEKWKSGVPRMIYMLGDIRVTGQPETAVEIAAAPGVEIKANVRKLALVVEQNAPGTSPLGLAFHSIGGSAWLYALVLLCPLLYLAIIVLMFVIIHSLRRSIRDELPLNSRNIGRTRLIGALIIFAEVCRAVSLWLMNGKAAELLAGTDIIIDTSFPISYWNILIGVLVLFTAEVFAIGYRLSEEQKLTI